MTVRMKRTESLLASTTQDFTPVSVGATYGRFLGFIAKNWASSAKAAAGTDAAVTLRLTDGDGIIFYLDAADANYAGTGTQLVRRVVGLSDAQTGTNILAVDNKGAAPAVANSVGEAIVVRTPIAVRVTNGATATDYFELRLFFDTGGVNG